MQTNAILTATSTAGKKINTTITYLRPEQKSHASELAIALNALTTNTYVSTQVNEMNIDPSASGNKPSPTVTLASNLRLTDNRYFVDVLTSDIPTTYLKLTGSYKQSSNVIGIFKEPIDSSTQETYPLPEGVIAAFIIATKTNYDGYSDIQMYLTAPETTNYAALYQNANLTP